MSRFVISVAILMISSVTFAQGANPSYSLSECTNTSGELVWDHPGILIPPAPTDGSVDKWAAERNSPLGKLGDPNRIAACKVMRAQVDCRSGAIRSRDEQVFAILNRTTAVQLAKYLDLAKQLTTENMICQDHN